MSADRELVAIITLASILAGCGGGSTGGKLRSVSLGIDPVMLLADYPTVVYTHDPQGDTSFFLTDVPVSALLAGRIANGQVVHIELLWAPRAGATPMDASAINASIRHVVMSAGELGVYGGAGFALPSRAPGRDRLSIAVRDTTLQLLESTDGFEDPLSPTRVVGSFTAELDPQLALKLRRALSQLVTNALGRPIHVRADEGECRPGGPYGAL